MQVNENLLSNLLAFVGVMSLVLLLTTWLFPEVPYPTMLTAFATVYVLLGVILYTFILMFWLIYGAVLRNVK